MIAWQKAIDLVEEVYRATKQFPADERYGLTQQLRRAVVSIPSNIAEGQGRRTTPDFLNFLSIAYGSLMEVESQVIIASRLAYLDSDSEKSLMDLAGKVGRLINGLSKSLRKKLQD